jgi:hypothetical protein
MQRVVRVRAQFSLAIPGICAGAVVLGAVATASAAATVAVPSPTGGASAPAPAVATARIGIGGITGPSGPLPSAGTLTLTPASLIAGQLAIASGRLPAAGAGGAVALEVRSAATWTTVARGVIGAGGRFAIGWRPQRTGELTLRAASAAPATTTASVATSPATATSEATLAVYRQVITTWYGPGFYGKRTACGETLSRAIVGVADRTLPCGTPVSLRYGSRTLVLPVIDRGPYGGGGATLDLTHAAAQELGITQTVPIGMIALAGPKLAASNWYPPGSSTGSGGSSADTGGAVAPSG